MFSSIVTKCKTNYNYKSEPFSARIYCMCVCACVRVCVVIVTVSPNQKPGFSQGFFLRSVTDGVLVPCRGRLWLA